MTIEQAMKRLYWRFGKGNFTPNENDLEALDFITDWANREMEQAILSQQLFAKLYTHIFTQTLMNRKNLASAVHETNELCQLPLSRFTDDFNFSFNVLKYKMYCDEKGIEYLEEEYRTKEDKELIMWHIENDKEFVKHLLGYWPKEKTEASLTKQISEAINLYKDMP